MNYSVKSRQGADEEIPTSEAPASFAPKEPEIEGEGLREQISTEENDIDEYASMFAGGKFQ